MLKIVAKEVLSVGFGSGRGFYPYIEPGSLKPEPEIVSNMPTMSENDISTVLLTKIDDPAMNDADFREFTRKILKQVHGK
jgi:hypothetical protein